MQHVFIVGSKGIPASYGGYETFVDKLTEYHKDNKKIKYHVACKNADFTECEYNNALCFNVKVPNIGSAQAILYDVRSIKKCCRYIKRYKIKHPIVYVLACRISVFSIYYQKKLHRLGGRLYVNPDGHEWKRSKWNKLVRAYWKWSERIMVCHSDLLVCDSKNIQKYIQKHYQKHNPKTTYIAYGAEVSNDFQSQTMEKNFLEWLDKNKLKLNEYYLVVGRFVPENNYETMLSEFMKSKTEKKLAIISTENKAMYDALNKKIGFESDDRIIFAGTVYDKALLWEIRKNAYAYIHGHEVGGTNPSLLEALGVAKPCLLLDVGFNSEVAGRAALYWNKSDGVLAECIEKADMLTRDEYKEYGRMAKERIEKAYSWTYISDQYEKLFLGSGV